MSFIQFTKPVKLIRHAAGSRVDGHWVEGNTTETNINVSIQPATQKDLLKLPEGDRNQGVVRIYTDVDTPLQGQDDVSKVSPDIIEVSGLKYQIQIVEDWTYWKAIPHFKSIALLREHKAEERA